MIDRLHGGDLKRYIYDPLSCARGIIDFSANINPLGLPPGVKRTIIKNVNGVVCYPEPDSRGLKKALAAFHGVKEDNLAVGNGSVELIYLIPKAFKAKRILVVTPAFSEYEFSAKSNGAKIIFVKTRESENFRIEPKKIEKLLPGVDLVFLGNPNNPTGTCLCVEELFPLVEACAKSKTVLAIDEAFMDFTGTCEEDSLLSAAQENRYLLVLRSLTKFFALPGLRLGYAAGDRDSIRRISALQYPWNINSLAQVAGKEAVKDGGYMDSSREYIAKQRELLLGGLSGIEGLKTFGSSSNFILCKLDGCAVKSAKVLNDKLIKRGLLTRNCGNFRGLNEKFFRVAVRKRNENLRLIASLMEIL